MTEIHKYECPDCGEGPWSKRGLANHRRYCKVLEPGPGEVSDGGDASQVIEDPSESSPAPEDPFQKWVDRVSSSIETLSENQKVLSADIKALRDNQYEAVVTAEAGPSFNFDGWEKVPEDIRKAGLKFLGDLGAAARAFAGGGTEDSDYELLKEVIKLDREKLKERRIKRITTVMEAISDPESQLYSIKPKKPKDPKIKKDEATKIG